MAGRVGTPSAAAGQAEERELPALHQPLRVEAWPNWQSHEIMLHRRMVNCWWMSQLEVGRRYRPCRRPHTGTWTGTVPAVVVVVAPGRGGAAAAVACAQEGRAGQAKVGSPL